MNPKPGYLTSEFWITIATTASGIVLAMVSNERAATIAHYANSGAAWTGAASLLAAALSAGLYAFGRGVAKSNG